MAANTVPRFVETPQVWFVACSTINKLASGAGSFDTLMTAGAQGSKVDLFVFRAAEDLEENTLRIFLQTAGATDYLYEEITFSAASGPLPNAEVANSEIQPTFPLIVPALHSLVCAVHTADVINVFAFGGDY